MAELLVKALVVAVLAAPFVMMLLAARNGGKWDGGADL
jgi:hypothetical protein